jgi:hypothetical protein
MHKKVKELAVEVLGGPSLQASSGLRQREVAEDASNGAYRN